MRSKSLITMNDPNALASESYKMARTNLHFMSIDKEQQIIMITSSTSEEGKTTTACNMAVTFAQSGKKILLVEADLRRARVHTIMNLPQEPGITSLLADRSSIEENIHHIEEVEGLDVMTAGPFPPAPAELLGSEAIGEFFEEAKGMYDMIIIDAPPILHVTDAAILSRVVDGVVLVIAANESKKKSIVRAKKALDAVGAKFLGVILTKVKVNRGSYYYYNYQNYYNKDGQNKKKVRKKARKKSSKD